MLEHKIDFMVTVEVKEANANGDPLSGNMPRTNAKGYGLMSDVSIKRKIRNRLQDMGQSIFVQANERIEDEFRSLENRFSAQFDKNDKDDDIERRANELWLDVRSFGQVFTYLKKSIGVRGPVSISMAKSLEPVVISSLQITRSTNGMEPKGDSSRSSDTMGTKHFVDYGIYVIKGSINAHFAEKTGFSEEDADIIKQALVSLFENDASSARPEGSMRVREVFWFTHSSKLGNVSSARVFDLLVFDMETPDKDCYEAYGIHLDEEKLAAYQAKGLTVEVLEGL
ncbi:TPA: type I-C CRISPR-associated protein Cas7/Csd2 [Streptococcus equi subsp. zooepidemicus]|uniref:CRISPR-associated protein n=1 Tax=Streptococcus equi subsp. zooepidemicus (strain H70) TaxID=553483 RepID=C0MDE3_STRS7|nr:type I-C CRISPR-associated protein Cas7/Csd2 [Streptococcus equi]KIS09058.1 CRISPR-associated protein, Csd2 family [Streptococcus equi subsp. zooepidemicus Sz5]KIS15330.1 CRISPR-associated protein, Csd2 family [Streptococcus equi subsp. zooepidemicus SzAM60]MCD3432260.1 type I-C CRISPR-associated protein Cas7/Csd2 [Streptococcus equi subsp. zooepidemicus]MCD3434281.1 type I-C CRISPR-associated protein Cas7/Csd2 [Streptococcus equi subsp. zooepidemicus]MCD3461926.1 type I-C CRISPR-associated